MTFKNNLTMAIASSVYTNENATNEKRTVPAVTFGETAIGCFH